MSLTRQATLLLVSMLCLAVLGSLCLHALNLQRVVQQQLSAQGRDSAALLALVLSEQGGNETQMHAVAAASFDLGPYQRLTLHGSDGRTWFDLRAPQRPAHVPGWLTQALPIDAAPGRALVTDRERVLGQLEILPRSNWAHESLAAALQQAAALLAALGALMAAAGALALQAWQRQLDLSLAHAQALEEGRLVIADEPRAPELKRLTRSLNAAVCRLRTWFDAQADQVAGLQKLAQTDPVTGLPNRRSFISLVDAGREADGLPVSALLLVRVTDLRGLNDRLGYESTNGVLRTIADVLRTYQDHVHCAFAGRLNGSDFALALPVAGVAEQTAASLMRALRVGPVGRVADAGLLIGGVDGALGVALPALLASADAALARAGAAGPFAVEVSQGPPGCTIQAGARAWRVGIEQCLDAGRLRLDERPVRDVHGELLHLHCPVLLQLEPDASPLSAPHWLPLAARSRLLPRVDLAAIGLALQAIARDSATRSVTVSVQSLDTPGFVDQLHDMLMRHAALAARLLLVVAEPTTKALIRELQQAATVWRASGVRIGIEASSATPLNGRGWLQSITLHHLCIAGHTIAGLAHEPALQQYARSLVVLAHGLGCKVVARDVDDAADLDTIRQLGFDGASATAVGAAEDVGAPTTATC